MSRVALITGAARRVGRSIAEHLAHKGFDIAFTYLSSQQEAQSLCDHVRELGRQVLAVRVDLADPQASVPMLIESFTQHFDRLDVLVHNASLYMPSPLQEMDLALARQLMAIHYDAPLLLTQGLESLLRQSKGHVVSMLDLLAERPWPNFLGYAASKGALQTLTLALARALAPQVTVNGIAPGVVAWPPDYPEADRAKYLQRVPLARAGTPDDVAALVHYLVTDGSYLTRQVIRLDGGRSVT